MQNSKFVSHAIELAKIAFHKGEIPVGAVIIDDEQNIIADSFNMVEAAQDPTAHAEIIAIRKACEIVGSKWLKNCSIYVTLEPCPMCAQAISLARIKRLYFGAYNMKGGGVDNGAKIFNASSCNHTPEIYGGIAEAPTAKLMQKIFKEKR